MNYGNLVTRTFGIVARRPYLWLLGLLAGGASTGNFSSSGSGYRQPAATYTGPTWATAQNIWNDNWQWMVAVLAIGLVVGLVLFILGCIATGAIVHAAVEHDNERAFGLGAAWRAGYATGWRIAGLRILAALLFIMPGLLVGALGLVAVTGIGSSVGITVTFGLLTAVALIGAIVFWIALALAYQFAQRFVVLENGHVAESLSAGFRVIGRHFKEVALGFLLLVLLSIVGGLGIALVAAVAAIPAGILGFAGWALGGWTGVVVTGSFAAVFFLGVLLAAAGAYAAYSSVYWTLLFTRIRALPEPAGRGALIPA